MFGSSSNSKEGAAAQSSHNEGNAGGPAAAINALTGALEHASNNGEKRTKNESPQGRSSSDNGEKKRRSSGVGSKASSFLQSAKSSLHFSQNPNSSSHFSRSSENSSNQTPLQKLGKQDPALVVPQGQHNNSAGESHPTARSTFSVGVWEDRNKKCRRTMEDTHAFLYNFLQTPSPALNAEPEKAKDDVTGSQQSLSELQTEMVETDNGYFAIFDGHAGTFAADWCGKKLHLILEEIIRKNPNAPIPELLDQTFTAVDNQLEKLPLKNSGCTAVTAVLRWEDRIPNSQSATGSTAIAPATVAAVKAEQGSEEKPHYEPAEAISHKLKSNSSRQRVLYTANVGDARIVLCRAGKALRLSYDHKGSDENEGRRVASQGGLILNNRVNGVLAVTRALGDAYMKDLVTGHPYTTETVIQPDMDEFIILACDGLWDVCTDQEAVDLVRAQQDPTIAAKSLVEHALARFSTDNLSCMVVRLNRSALLTASKEPQSAIGVEGDAPLPSTSSETPQEGNLKRVSEASKIVSDAKKKVEAEGGNAVGISGSNSGKGHDQAPLSPSHTSSPSPPLDANPPPLSPNANPLAASTVTGEIPKLNQPPPPKNLNLKEGSERKSEELERVKEEEDEHDSKEVDLQGGEAASPETRKSLSLPYGQDGVKK